MAMGSPLSATVSTDPFAVDPDPDHPKPPAEVADPEAPYGRNPKTGKPYKMSPEQRKQMGEQMLRGRVEKGKASPKSSIGAPPRMKAGKSSGSDPATDKYTEAAATILAVPNVLLQTAGKVTGNRAIQLDAITLALYTPPLAEGIGEAAARDERIARVLDKVVKLVPAGTLAMTASALILQVAVNHGLMPSSPVLGTMSPEDLLAMAESATDGDTD